MEDIAKLANVSISTVSKIVNGKDDNINPKTRERVLDIVREYNYVPYSSAKKNINQKTFLLGFIYNGARQMKEIAAGVMSCAKRHGYGVILCDSGGDAAQEGKFVAMLCRNEVDGVLWEKADPESRETDERFGDQKIPFLLVGSKPSGQNDDFAIDYEQMGYNATKKLVSLGHRHVGCVIRSDSALQQNFAQGFRRCLYEMRIFFEEGKYIIDSPSLKSEALSMGFTGFVCGEGDIAEELCRMARQCSLKIPRDLSVVAVLDDDRSHPNCDASWLTPPLRDYGEALCGRLLSQVEKNGGPPPCGVDWGVEVVDSAGVDVPYDSRRKNILVIGSVHIDVLINVEDLPQVGKTMNVKGINTIPGGKGLNQALGASKLGANVSLIARIGRDADGANISKLINENRIDPHSLTVDEHASTGKAYIYIPPGGDSSIVIYAGANDKLRVEDISKNENLFQNVGYCLLPMEIPIKTVEFAAEIAKRHGIKTILKPTALKEISGSLLEKVDIFVPNEKESEALCPHLESVEDKARFFLDMGAGIVIVTMGASGCYLRDASHSQYFPATSFPSLDTTGGADAFISALAVYLNENFDIAEAIRRANCAAGFCVARQGVFPAMVDRVTLELYLAGR